MDPQSSGIVRQPLRRSGLLAILGLLIPLSITTIACGGGGATTTTGSSSTASGATSKPAQAAKVGDTITVNGVSTTLVSVKPIQAGQYDTAPKAGDGYYVLHVKVVNHGTGTADYNEIDYKILTGAGSTVDTQAFLSAEPDNALLQSGQLAANGSVEGDLVFEIGTSDHGAKLVWQPGFDTSLDNVWSLGL